MKQLTLRRALIGCTAVVVIAFLTAGVAGNNQSGTRAVIGDTAWMVALVGALIVIALAVATLIRSTLRHSKQRTGA